jgi:alpha,alpha-trehalase
LKKLFVRSALLMLAFFPFLAQAQLFFPKAFGELFERVQMEQVFEDGKTFPDCTPKMAPEQIMERYEQMKAQPGFVLADFVREHFTIPTNEAVAYKGDPNRPVKVHIDSLWQVLTREPDATGGTLLPLPNSYVVPGGRFREIYYWDSYFTMLGLRASGRRDMMRNMVQNFAHLINAYGFIPNGNRSYYLSRSQPPFFTQMVKLLAEEEGPAVLNEFLPAIEKEYAFWMKGAETMGTQTQAFSRVVKMPNGTLLNRYYDDWGTPRTESYREDVELAESSSRPHEELWRDLRAACESGWDFSSRWLTDENDLSTIRTTELIPVDLNSLLFDVELTLAGIYGLENRTEEQAKMARRALERQEAINLYCWNEKLNTYSDYDFVKEEPVNLYTAAMAYPLFFNLASQEMAERTEKQLRQKLLKRGGIATTRNKSGQQWDAPNGWPPLQWVAVQGLKNYRLDKTANKIAQRWVDNNLRVYNNQAKLVEKYNVYDIKLGAGGGEYPLQDGFGWTNGVLLALMQQMQER